MIDMSLRLANCLDIDSKSKYRYEELESDTNGKQTFSQSGKSPSFYSSHQIMFMKITKKIRDVKTRCSECNKELKH